MTADGNLAPRSAPRRGIGVFGGSFNPPHTTHRRIAAVALEQLPIAELLVVPAGDHPHKRRRDMAPASHRLAMSRLAFDGLADVTVDDREVRRAGPSFTVDTLAALARERPDCPLWFLIGADNLRLLPTWHDHHRLLALATVATFPRLGASLDARELVGLDLTPEERDALLRHRLTMPADGVAAADLRARLARGERQLAELSPAVERYLVEHHLYGT